MIRTGGLIAIDNVLWGGRVANPEFGDNNTEVIRQFNQMLYNDERVTISLVPIADGVTLALKRG